MRCWTVVDGAVSGDVFAAFVEQALTPQPNAGDVVVLDDLSSHKPQRTRALIEARGAQLLFLPPYSPSSIPLR